MGVAERECKGDPSQQSFLLTLTNRHGSPPNAVSRDLLPLRAPLQLEGKQLHRELRERIPERFVDVVLDLLHSGLVFHGGLMLNSIAIHAVQST
jgi:hypothetical protein